MKKTKLHMILSSIVVLLPVIFVLLFGDRLSAVVPIHFGITGQADNFASMKFAFITIVSILAVLHWLCVFITLKDRGNKEQNPKILSLVMWIVPTIALFMSMMMLMTAMGKYDSIFSGICLFLGICLILMGNYLPKCKQNYTIGVKIKWTLESEENWYATHRFTGKLWVIIGILMIAGMLLPEKLFPAVLIALIVLLSVPPAVYSYLYHKKQVREGWTKEKELPAAFSKKVFICVMVIVVAILAGCGVIMFTGNIEYSFGEEALEIKATYYQDLSVDYSSISEISYIDDFDGGTRTFGFASARLLLGAFQCDEYGVYTRYTYTGDKAAVKLVVGGETLIIGAKTNEETMEMYKSLLERINLTDTEP